MKAVVRIRQRISRPAKKLYYRTLLVAGVCESIGVWLFNVNSHESKSMMLRFAGTNLFFIIYSSVIAFLVLWVALRWMTTVGVLATLYSRGKQGQRSVGTLLGHIRGEVLRVSPGDRLTLKSVAQSHRRDMSGNQVGYLWTLKNGQEKVRCDVDAPVTDDERQQLQRWLESLSHH
jgi:hypothetical protein